jgi:hypothetical protein
MDWSSGLTQSLSERPHVAYVLPQASPRGDRLSGVPTMLVVAVPRPLGSAGIEAELKPKVVETFDTVADAYKRLRRLQGQDIQNKLRNDSLSPAQERRYKRLKDEIISEVKSLRLNQARIDALVEQLYDINKRLVGYEGPANSREGLDRRLPTEAAAARLLK